ncbi:probable U3 small nucleolar RNA-associated protein 11 [Centruroides vittatus]|uniref:probable U3 small nucleolar RNA-associated protein 11 n=1 Tax=Centruroides vittatus TaxID=120091 RepID=UPI003510A770
MSSLTKISKSRQRLHRERHQPESRQQVGFLEKKKDYKLRARHYHRKQNKLRVLRQKALNKNPDEFYFHMINSEIQDGIHREKDKPEEYTDDQLKLMQTQDINYINYKQSTEIKKIDKLQSGLHLLDVEDKPANKHVFFVDMKKEVKNFDIASRLDTHPSLLNRTYNRPRLKTLQEMKLSDVDDESLEIILKQRRKQYDELEKRIHRENELSILSQKMAMKKLLLNKKDPPFKKVKEGSKEAPPIYQWHKERKK